MDVEIPVFLYDVTTADAQPRLIVSCRAAADAQELASRLNAMQRDGKLGTETFTAAEPRETTTIMTVDAGASVEIQGYRVSLETVAARLDAADKSATGKPLP